MVASCRRDAHRLADMSQHGAPLSNLAPFDTLPPEPLRAIFLHLPADQRARAACVCRGWRAVAADPARLDLSSGSGVTCRLDDAALLAATARAQGRLEVLNFSRDLMSTAVSLAALRNVAAANAATLRELRELFVHTPDADEESGLTALEALLTAAPALEVLEAFVCVTVALRSASCAMSRRLARCACPAYVSCETNLARTSARR